MNEYCPEARYVKRLANPDSFPERFEDKGLKVLLFDYQKPEVA